MKKKIVNHIFVGLGFAIAYALYIVCRWSDTTFGVGLDEIVFTMTFPLKGANTAPVASALKYCLPGLIAVIVAYAVFAVIDIRCSFTKNIALKIKDRIFSIDLRRLIRRAVALLSCLSIILSFIYADRTYKVVDYVKTQLSVSDIYETHYVDPTNMTFTLKNKDGKYKNLLYIYLESMETTYTSKDNGGRQDKCHIPNLVKLANENVSFSNTDKLGGFHNTAGTGYTLGALVSTTSGVPFSFSSGVSHGLSTKAAGLVTVGDILDEFGYKQEFLCGSDASFAGRDEYFTQHGNYELYDLFTAREKGYVPKDYFEFWGIEDKYLYEIAKDELTRLSQEDAPFNLTMLTVDTHHTGGYVCNICGNDFNSPTENVVACADRQLGSFIEWCKKQSFFEDTVIIISGDHPRMDTFMVDGIDYFDRTVYNCIIGSELTPEHTQNRTFTSLDMFPTTLSALGFSWGGARLGLGTDMFSGEETLAERLGYDYLNNELGKQSKYYMNNFY